MEKKGVVIGDVVMLNSEKMVEVHEAVYMTVTDKCDEATNIECSWFSGGIVMSEWFAPEALTKIPL